MLFVLQLNVVIYVQKVTSLLISLTVSLDYPSLHRNMLYDVDVSKFLWSQSVRHNKMCPGIRHSPDVPFSSGALRCKARAFTPAVEKYN